jgi:hypothetical protein
MVMRGIAGSLLIGMSAALASGALTLAGLGFALSAQPTSIVSPIIQHVDRTHKGDRLDMHTTIYKRPMQKRRNRVMAGCDPAFSALSSSTHSNFSRRCVA